MENALEGEDVSVFKPASGVLLFAWQFLESYKSVTLESMATAFDVGLPFLDNEVADFICAGRISAKIDKVAGIVETKR